MGRVAELLEEMERLFRGYSLDDYGDYLASLRALYLEGDRRQFLEELSDPLMWGGAGSVVDVGPHGGRWTDADQAAGDESRFRHLVVELVGELDAQGLASDRAKAAARAFRDFDDMSGEVPG